LALSLEAADAKYQLQSHPILEGELRRVLRGVNEFESSVFNSIDDDNNGRIEIEGKSKKTPPPRKMSKSSGSGSKNKAPSISRALSSEFSDVGVIHW
jgi:hypothetical protein